MEVSSVIHVAAGYINNRIVTSGIQFIYQYPFTNLQGIHYRTQDLGNATQRIKWLDFLFEYLIAVQFFIIKHRRTFLHIAAAFQDLAHNCGNPALACLPFGSVQFTGQKIIVRRGHFVHQRR